MMYKRETKEYEAFSLIEMLITIIILGFVLITCALVLTTLIKVSTVSTNKARVRIESEYMQELLKRTIRTTDPSNVNLYNTSRMRTYDSAGSTTKTNLINPDPYTKPLGESTIGNEIHLRPFGSDRWVCVAFFYGANGEEESDGETPKGYILKTTMDSLKYEPSHCFDSSQNKPYNYIVLNSRFVNVSDMGILYTMTEDKNKEFILNMKSDAINWYFAKGAPLSREVFRQSIVKTEGVMW